MKIIFLDFDGVLTTPSSDYTFTKDAIDRLGHILSETGAKLVITSSWRSETVEQMRNLLSGNQSSATRYIRFPYVKEIIGVTPHCGAWLRGQEIQKWLENTRFPVERYAIIDDEEQYLQNQKPFLVRTSHSIGITDEDVESVIRLLNHK